MFSYNLNSLIIFWQTFINKFAIDVECDTDF
jgi:hypothetical protein